MRRGAVAVALLLLAGCSSSTRATTHSSPSSPASSPSSPATAPSSPATAPSSPATSELETRCGSYADGVRAAPFAFPAGDGTKLVGVEMGAGPRGVVMVHELGSAGLCGWLPYGKYLADHGLHVLLYDTRCAGRSSCPGGARGTDLVDDVAGAKAELVKRGARRVAVVGASFGGPIAVAAAVAVRGIRACVVLSGDLWDEDLGGLTGQQAARRLAVPLLYAVATEDEDRLPTVRHIVAMIKPSLVELQVIGGANHGWDLVGGALSEPFTPLAAQVYRFLVAHLR